MTARALLVGIALTIGGVGGFVVSVEVRLSEIERRLERVDLVLALALPVDEGRLK